MAIWYSDATVSSTRTENKRESGNLVGKEVHLAKVTYTFTGSEANAELIYLLTLPKGAEILTDQCKVVSSGTINSAAMGTCTIDVGDLDTTNDDNRYATLLNVNAAGEDAFDEVPNHALEEQCYITAKINLSGTPTVVADETLTFYIYYVKPRF